MHECARTKRVLLPEWQHSDGNLAAHLGEIVEELFCPWWAFAFEPNRKRNSLALAKPTLEACGARRRFRCAAGITPQFFC
jgi:hypothetical protein